MVRKMANGPMQALHEGYVQSVEATHYMSPLHYSMYKAVYSVFVSNTQPQVLLSLNDKLPVIIITHALQLYSHEDKLSI